MMNKEDLIVFENKIYISLIKILYQYKYLIKDLNDTHN